MMMKINTRFGVFILFFFPMLSVCKQQKGWINVPVVNLRSEPKTMDCSLQLPLKQKDNPFQVSQLLYGESVLIHDRKHDKKRNVWLKISALDQEIMISDGKKIGCPGWILKDAVCSIESYMSPNLVVSALTTHIVDELGKIIMTLSIGSKFYGEKISDGMWQVHIPGYKKSFVSDKDVHALGEIDQSVSMLRKSLVKKAKEFIGMPYSWGGRTPYNFSCCPCSVDCSDFINLVFLAHGIKIMKNSHSQYLGSKHIEHGKNLKPGDLIFLAPCQSNPVRMSHVMMYIGDDKLIESASSCGGVQEIEFVQRVGKKHTEMRSGDKTVSVTTNGVLGDQYYIYFGTYL